MAVRAVALAFVMMALAASGGAADPNAPSKAFEDKQLGIAFKYPEGFRIGRYKNPAPMPGGWKLVAVLVDPARLEGAPVDSIPREKVPTIEFVESTGIPARMQVANTRRPDMAQYKKTIGGRTVMALPGVFAPYGEGVWFYLVPLAEDRALMVFAPKSVEQTTAQGAPALVPTGYDAAVESILSTLAVAK